MKKAFLFFLCFFFFCFAYFQRYRPVSLQMVNSTTKRVEIKGEVAKPGLYTLDSDAILDDLIKEAGGFNEQADVASLSLTKPLRDSEVIVVAKKDETEKISINTASVEQLDTLPGIGPSIAQRIVDYRNQISFSSLEQIKEVKGIGDKLYEKIKDRISL